MLSPQPRYNKFTVQILANIPDDKLDFSIWDYIWQLIGENSNNIEKIVSTLPPSFQMVFLTFLLENDVNNGGFNQYFFNSSGQYAYQTLDALKLIGADVHYMLLQKAIAIHLGEQENQKLQSLYSQNALKFFSETYKYTALNECDKEFYNLNISLGKIRVKFIREHPELFITE